MQEAFFLFGTVGTAKQPFDRFVLWVDEAARRLALSGLIQTGTSRARPQHCLAREYLSRAEFQEVVSRAGAIVTHGGCGSIIPAVQCGKRPLVIARRRHLGEHVNDHQLELIAELGRAGLIQPVETLDDLIRGLGQARRPFPQTVGLSNDRMLSLVADFLEAH